MAAAPQPKGEGTILFVEDDDAVREGTTRLLARLGYTVLAAAGGEAAIARARAYEGRIDLIVADLIMPGMTGPEVVDAVRAIVPDLPALFVSGYADEAVLERLRPGNAEILQKPIRVKDLHERIQALIG
jgi:two-component system cell cycle sensor histidine kinase/response regulator CckA